jgi:hypothetical protein
MVNDIAHGPLWACPKSDDCKGKEEIRNWYTAGDATALRKVNGSLVGREAKREGETGKGG